MSQKLISYLMVLFSSIALIASKDCKYSEEIVTICSKDINQSGKKGFIIDKPGKYVVCEDIQFKPCKKNKSHAAITIISSNVTLDLGDYTLSQKTSKHKKHSNVSGIRVKNANSVSIKNGSISDFKKAGIKIDTSTDLSITNISILRTGVENSFGGLQINDSGDITIKDIEALNNFGCGMYLHGVYKATISNSHFNDNIGGNVAPQFFFGAGEVCSGAYLDSSPTTVSSDVLFQNCSFNKNTAGGDAGGLEVGPYSLLPVRNVTISNCEFLDNAMNGVATQFNDASGLVLVLVDNYVIQDCVASGQRHPGSQGGFAAVSGATGFSINACNNGVIKNSQAFDNSGEGFSSIGMRFRGCTNQFIQNCECSKNINDGNGQAFGFYTDNDNFPSFSPLGSAYVFDSCIAQQNFSTSGISGGLKIANLTCSTIQNCISQENANGILITDSNVPQIALHNIFNNNTVQCNTLSGINNQVTGDNAFIKNISENNGPLGVLNYVGIPAGTPIAVWSIAGGFPAGVTNPYINLDITP